MPLRVLPSTYVYIYRAGVQESISKILLYIFPSSHTQTLKLFLYRYLSPTQTDFLHSLTAQLNMHNKYHPFHYLSYNFFFSKSSISLHPMHTSSALNSSDTILLLRLWLERIMSPILVICRAKNPHWFFISNIAKRIRCIYCFTYCRDISAVCFVFFTYFIAISYGGVCVASCPIWLRYWCFWRILSKFLFILSCKKLFS